MFIGHFAVGLASKPLAPRTSLGTLFLAAGFIDVLWPFFLLFGWEHVRIVPGITAVMPLDLYHYPYSHSLLATLGWSVLFAAVYFAVTRYARGTWVVGVGVLSHWWLDFFSHRPDLPIGFRDDGPKVGLGLWNSVSGTVIIESFMFAVGIFLYLRTTRPIDKMGTWAFASLMVLLYGMYLGNVFGPPPPSAEVLAYSAPVILALYAWPYWADRHRRSVIVETWSKK